MKKKHIMVMSRGERLLMGAASLAEGIIFEAFDGKRVRVIIKELVEDSQEDKLVRKIQQIPELVPE